MKSGVTARILDIPKRVLDTIWKLLCHVNSTHKMVSIDEFKKDAVDAFTAFTEVTYLYHNLYFLILICSAHKL